MNNNLLQQALIHCSYHGSLQCARQVFAHLKGDMTNTILPMPWECSRIAPEDINVYTDGSWQFPLRQYFALGGAGVWWPNRELAAHKASQAEQELACIAQEADGVRLCTHIGGFSGSSTRTAGIIAISCHGPVHIGSDRTKLTLSFEV